MKKTMKNLLLIVATVLAFTFGSFAQNAADSRGISFQGIARDASGNVFASKTVNVTFTIQNGTTTVYQETQNGLTTDVAGVFSTVIGTIGATVASGFKYSSFSNIDFSIQYNIQVGVAINGGAAVTIGTYILQAVPYAKYASNGVPPGTIMALCRNYLPCRLGFLRWDSI